ncbi:MAG: hypothetical protein NTZ62_10245 [Actinobacteria bacterium]|nr:hypothetical protein [Actinomycetota bacterium]
MDELDLDDDVDAWLDASLLRYASIKDITPSDRAMALRRRPAAMASAMLEGVNFSDTDTMVLLTQTTMLAPATAPDTNQNIRRIMTALQRQCYR